MATAITHSKVSAVADGSDTTLVRPSDWNDDHIFEIDAVDIVGLASVATDAIWDTAGDLAVGSGSNTAAKLVRGSSGQVLAATSSTIAYRDDFTVVSFFHTGALVITTDTTPVPAKRWRNRTGRTLTFALACADLGVVNTGADVHVDIRVDATTTVGTITMVASGTGIYETSTFSPTTIADGHYFSVLVSQIGSTIAGSELSGNVYLKG